LRFTLPRPALCRPRLLWTGKQLIAAVVAAATAGMPPLTMSAKAKVPPEYWGERPPAKGAPLGEGELLFHKVCGLGIMPRCGNLVARLG
jgi:hypothetical protein